MNLGKKLREKIRSADLENLTVWDARETDALMRKPKMSRVNFFLDKFSI